MCNVFLSQHCSYQHHPPMVQNNCISSKFFKRRISTKDINKTTPFRKSDTIIMLLLKILPDESCFHKGRFCSRSFFMRNRLFSSSNNIQSFTHLVFLIGETISYYRTFKYRKNSSVFIPLDLITPSTKLDPHI